MKISYPFVSEYICTLRGGSQSILVKASDGLHYVAKFASNLQGPNLSFNESIGSELYRACGLRVPSWTPLVITEAFLDQNPSSWMRSPEGPVRPASGLCFGSRYLGGDGIRLLQILPGTSFRRVRNQASFWLAWLIDICAVHVDDRQVVYVEEGKGWLDAFFVDFGHLFGGPKGDECKHFQASRYLDPRIYPDIDSEQISHFKTTVSGLDRGKLWQLVRELPDGWKTTSAAEGFEQCLSRLSSPKLLQCILDTIVDSIRRNVRSEYRSVQSCGEPPLQVLCLGVSGAARERHPVAAPSGHRACA